MKKILVNPLLTLFYLSLALFISSCGFQLNRNQVSLPEGAQSLAILPIENKSFTPSLDVQLQERLSELLNRANIPLLAANRADLTMKIIITGSGSQRNEVTLGNSLIYRYKRTHIAKVWLRDLRNNREIFSGEIIQGEYTRESTNSNLSSFDIREDQSLALDQLTKQISNKLTQSF